MELFLHPLHHLTCGILQYEDSVINPGLNAQVDWEALMPHQWWGKEKEDALTKSTQGGASGSQQQQLASASCGTRAVLWLKPGKFEYGCRATPEHWPLGAFPSSLTG